MLTQEYLKLYLRYIPSTGDFIWISHHNRSDVIGKKAGSICKIHGYRIIGLQGIQYRAHRLAFLYMENKIPAEIDHDDNNRANNAWKNLREVTRAQNQQNRCINKNNVYNCKGLTYRPKKGLWLGQIQTNGKRLCKSSKDMNIVVAWLETTRERNHTEFARYA